MKTVWVFKVKKFWGWNNPGEVMHVHSWWMERIPNETSVTKTVGEGMEGSGWNALAGFNVRELGSMLTTKKLAFDKSKVKAGQH